MTAPQAYAAAVDALQAARRARQDALRHCENYEAGEDADHTGYPGSPGYAACFWDGERARTDWCEACAARTDLGDLKELKRAKARAQAEVLRAGRELGAPEGDSITRTSIALVEAREEVKRLTKERAACTCDFEWRDSQSNQPQPPLRERGPGWKDLLTVKGRECADAPCWACYDTGDGAITDYGRVPEIAPIGDADGFCPSCERRQALHEQLRAARRRVVALTSGHLAATKAHMRRIGRLPPQEKRPPPKLWEPTPTPPPVKVEPLPLRGDEDVPF